MIGIDIVDIRRFRKIRKKDFAEWSKAFSVKEWEYAFSFTKPAERLASTFAAKEAIIKAFEGRMKVNDIEILRNKSGKPVAYSNDKIISVFLSLSHDGAIAIAIAFLHKHG